MQDKSITSGQFGADPFLPARIRQLEVYPAHYGYYATGLFYFPDGTHQQPRQHSPGGQVLRDEGMQKLWRI
jgi:hypothetical protein